MAWQGITGTEILIKRLLVIGIDGGTWRVLDPLLAANKLPNLKKLMTKGAFGILESTIPPFTTPAWNSLLTGLTPHSLGIYNFMHWSRDSYDREPYFENVRQRPTLFDVLADEGFKITALNVPSVHSAATVRGLCVAGFLYRNVTEIFGPPLLKELIEKRFGRYDVDIVDVDKSTGKVTDRASNVAERIFDLTERRCAIAEYLLTDFEWHFAFLVFTGSDRIQHKLWTRKDIISKYFIFLDQCIGKLLDVCPENTGIVILSDHGFGPQERVFCLNDWLIQEGYLTLTEEGDSIARGLMNFILKYGLYRVRDVLPASVSHFLEEKFFSFTPIEQAPIDWERTKAVAFSVCGDIFINSVGRFPKGIVSDDEYPELVAELEEKLHVAVKQNFGQEPSIVKRETLLRNHSEIPDLTIQINDVVQGVDTSVGHSFQSYRTVYGNHRSDGMIIFTVPGVRMENGLGKAHITDIAPTILDLLGVPPPWKMDGTSLVSRIKGESS